MNTIFLLPLLFAYQITLAQTNPLGVFDHHADVGNPALKGTVTYQKSDRSYQLRGAGYNIWFARDEFQYLYKNLKGDFTLTAQVEFIGVGKDPHRKIGWMVRESLADTAVHVSAVSHGDGLVVMQWRTAPGAAMRDPEDEIFSPEKTLPPIIQLQRVGKSFTMRVGKPGEALKTVGSYEANLPDAVLGGLFICSHNPAVLEEARIWNVSIQQSAPKK
ncbi:MAG: hypothetical protein H7Y12_06370 [Sphingobacteriaceae bacterium]|nr:hypothetical protein [Cytophagaceae bacterium]